MAIYILAGGAFRSLYIHPLPKSTSPENSLKILSNTSTSPQKIKIPTSFSLGINYPNPFNPETIIPVNIPQKSNIELTIYNISGAKIKTLHFGSLAAGEHRFRWNGKNETGQRVASGIYIYRLSGANGLNMTRKMFMIK